MSPLPPIPSQWMWTSLGEVAQVRLGKMLSPKAATVGKKRAYLRNQNVRWGSIDYSDVQAMGFTDEEAVKFEVRPGDVLVCEGGEVGRSAVYRRAAGEFLYQKALHRVRCGPAVLPEFFQYYMAHEMAARVVTPRPSETTIQHLPLEKMLRLPIPLPPAAEQRRIVEALERSFTRLDAAVMSLNRIRTRLIQYRASVLKAACYGSLVDVLDPTSTARLDEVAEIKGGLAKGKKRKSHATRPVPYLRVANVQRGALNLTEVKTMEASAEEVAALTLQEGDVLLNEGGDRDKLGRGWVWEGQIAGCIHQNHVFRARPNRKRVLPKFLSHYCNTVGQAYFMQEGKHTTNMASISRTKLAALPIVLPSVRDQERILAEVERRLSVSDALLGEVDNSLARCRRMRQVILKQAFEGRLVPQGPRDEMAAVHRGGPLQSSPGAR